MSGEPQDTGLFIVDNGVTGSTGLRYLEGWTDISRAADVTTGFFEIGALLELAKLLSGGR